LIPPLLGFYAKLFVIAALANTAHFALAIITIICSVISCVRYLNIIQISNMKMNGLIGSAN
jgi:NADH:ubiquinone oxidoreductase subunit 2 (subunit N)